MHTIFIDTMVWLHYRPIQDIDWPQVLAADAVTIVVPRVTIRELDHQKNLHPNATIRERASRVLAGLEGYFSGSPRPVRENVSIVRYTGVPAVESPNLALDPAWNDDVLIGCVLGWSRDNPGARVTLITQDTGPLLTAKDAGLSAIRLSDNLRLPPALDDTERELAQLRRELLRSQAARPELSVVLANQPPSGPLRIQLPAAPTQDHAAWDNEREELARRFPPAEQRTSSLGAGMFPSSREYDRYNKDRFEYLEAYSRYQLQRWKYQCDRTLHFSIEPVLVNEGTQPGDDIDVTLHIPDPVLVWEDTYELEEPSPPQAPVRPRSPMEMTMQQARVTIPRVPSLADILDSRVPSNVSKPTVRKTNSHEIDYHVIRLKHGHTASLGGLALYFPSLPDVTSFGIDYTVRAANLIDPATGTVHVVIAPPHAT